MTLDREKARETLSVLLAGREVPDAVLDLLEECMLPEGWPDLWRILAAVYPEDVFPQQSRQADWGNGPQVVSLLRLLGRAEDRLSALRTEAAEFRHKAGEQYAKEYGAAREAERKLSGVRALCAAEDAGAPPDARLVRTALLLEILDGASS